ncbi:MAG TPA: DUF3800 domain-containing protein [Solirubrobacteraceae bacterium]|nr:DUF3800 domain-containing protein [Solirubrobacteraceae bacterium]
MSLPIVVMDEAGHTGENLLDATQPVYALAGLRIEPSLAETAVRAALSRTQKTTKELKFSSLRKSNVGRKNMLALLEEIDLKSLDAAAAVFHKPWMVAAKMIDELVDPRMLAKGIQGAWYAGGAAKNMTDAFYRFAPRALGSLYDDLACAFMMMVRDYTPEAGAAFLSALQRCKIACRDGQVHELLSVMIDTQTELDAEFAGREDALDPALPALFWQGSHWSERLSERFEILHDSTLVRRWQETVFGEIQANMAHRTEPESYAVGEITIGLPTLLNEIRFETSHNDPRVQVADIIAGAAAHVYSVSSESRRDEGDFAKRLARAGVGALLEHVVGPPIA